MIFKRAKLNEATAGDARAALWHWWLPGLLALLALLANFAPLQRLDLLAFDLLASFAPAARPAPAAVIVAIDERSLQQLGRWPWPRRTHALLLDRMQAAPPASIAFAILFDQPDMHDAAGDAAFASAIKQAGRVILPVMPGVGGDGSGLTAVVPTRQLAAAAAALGHVDAEIDPDGRLRRIYLRAGIGAEQWSALPQAALELPRPDPKLALPGLRADFQAASSDTTWRRDAEVLPRPDRNRPLEQLSYVDVLNDPGLAARLRDRSVFVGITAAGIGGAFATASSPRGSLMPAVEFHARAFEALRAGDVITPLNRTAIGLITLLAIVAGSLAHRRYKRLPWSANVLVIGLPLLISVALLLFGRLWYPPVAATLALGVGYALWAAASFRATWLDLFLARGRAAVTLNAVADGVVSVDRQGRIEFVNQVAASLLGRDATALRGQALDQLLAELGADGHGVRDALARCAARRETVHLAEPIRLGGPGGPMVRIVIGPLPGPRGQVVGAVLALSDISAVVAAGEQLQHQATHDALTDLPNRALLRNMIKRGIASARRGGTTVGVLFLDLDDFKRVNDSYGHHMGDRVLCNVASRLKAACRGSDTVGRWGGDEFVIVLPDLASADAIESVARKLLVALSEPLILDGASFHIAGTIGISHGPEDGEDPDHLLGMADTAMYRIKQSGGRNYGFASAEMSLLSRQRMDIETGLRAALEHGELEVFYQPQVEIDTGSLHGFEALIRWNRPGHGLVMPGAFIPVAEESDLILDLGAWVLDEVARQIRQWLDEDLNVMPVAVNVSARQCLSNSLVGMVAATLERHAIPARLLELEITETAAMTDLEHVEKLLIELEALGVGVALDDFGTGYSSLSHLRRFPISVLKIDQSFVADALRVSDDAAIVGAIIALAHNLGLKVIGEGVETAAQRDFLAGHACDIAQGYHYSRPKKAEAVREYMLPGISINPPTAAKMNAEQTSAEEDNPE